MAKIENLFAARFIRARRNNKLLSFLSITSVFGVMLGVATLIIVVSVMDGFTENLKSKFLGANPHVLVSHIDGTPINDWQKYTDIITQQPHVTGAAPLVLGNAMITSERSISGVIVRGILPDIEREFTSIDKTIVRGDLSKLLPSANGELPGIILGQEIAFSSASLPGKEVTLVSPTITRGAFGVIPKMRKFRVVGFVDTGIYEHNKSLVYIHMDEAQDFFMLGDNVNALTVMTDDSSLSLDVAKNIQSKLNVGDEFLFWARDWLSMNSSLFAALKLEQYAMFVILTLIIVVASFNIVSMISVTVKDKQKEIAIIRAMGGSERLIRKIFIRQGVIIGVVGIILGDILALGITFVLKNFEIVKIPKEIYHSSTIPIILSADIFVIVNVCAVVITYLAAVVPARMSAKVDPIEAIRND